MATEQHISAAGKTTLWEGTIVQVDGASLKQETCWRTYFSLHQRKWQYYFCKKMIEKGKISSVKKRFSPSFQVSLTSNGNALTQRRVLSECRLWHHRCWFLQSAKIFQQHFDIPCQGAVVNVHDHNLTHQCEAGACYSQSSAKGHWRLAEANPKQL